jgi:hypothetical protein
VLSPSVTLNQQDTNIAHRMDPHASRAHRIEGAAAKARSTRRTLCAYPKTAYSAWSPRFSSTAPVFPHPSSPISHTPYQQTAVGPTRQPPHFLIHLPPPLSTFVSPRCLALSASRPSLPILVARPCRTASSSGGRPAPVLFPLASKPRAGAAPPLRRPPRTRSHLRRRSSGGGGTPLSLSLSCRRRVWRRQRTAPAPTYGEPPSVARGSEQAHDSGGGAREQGGSLASGP